MASLWGKALGMKEVSALGNGILESPGENARKIHEAMQSLLDSRPVVLAYIRDGRLQAVSSPCHSRCTTLTPYVQRLLYQSTVQRAIELLWACPFHCSNQPWVPWLVYQHVAGCIGDSNIIVEPLKFAGSESMGQEACVCSWIADAVCWSARGKEDWASPSEGGQVSWTVTFGEGEGTRCPVEQAERQLKAGPGSERVSECGAGVRKMPKVPALAAGGAPPLEKHLPVVAAKFV